MADDARREPERRGQADSPIRIRRLREADYFWLERLDCAPLPMERDSIYLLFALHFAELCFVAERPEDRQPIGYVLGLMSVDGSTAHVHALFVEPAWRRKQIGAELMHRFMAAAGASGAKHIVLYTVRAQAFYEKLGFRRGWPGARSALHDHIEIDRGAVCMHLSIGRS